MNWLKNVNLVVVVVLSLILLVLPLFSGCAPEPTPTPTAEKIDIEILSNPVGHTGYVMSMALADVINNHSARLRATCLETTPIENWRRLASYSPERRARQILYSSLIQSWEARKGEEPYEGPYNDHRYLSVVMTASIAFFTLDPKIKTPQDLVGKRIGIGTVGSSTNYVPKMVMEHGWGITEDQVKYEALGFGGCKDALLDRTIDVAIGTVMPKGAEEWREWLEVPATTELLAAAECYVISWDEEALAKVREATGCPMYPVKCEAQVSGKTSLPRWIGGTWPNSWWVDKTMADDVAEEIISIIYNNVEEFSDYHVAGRIMTADMLYACPEPLENWHPGVLKFYASKEIKPGID